jgi:integrase
VWWYNFVFAGRHIQESSKSESKTVAKEAEKKRRRELEDGFNNLTSNSRVQRVQTVCSLASTFLDEYRVRKPKSATFAEYALRHPVRLLGEMIVAEIGDRDITVYQTARLKECASPKTINDEVVYLLRILGDRGEILRARLRKSRSLKLAVTSRPGKAYTADDKTALEAAAASSRSHRFRLFLTLATHTGMRSKELRTVQWKGLDLDKAILTVGESKTESGSGRTIPLNSTALPAIRQYADWYRQRFGDVKPDWYVFPFGRPHPSDPTKPVTTLKTAWRNAKDKAGVTGRTHDLRHTAITELAESGAPDQVIKDIVGHVTPQMLRHYSHVRTEAKRAALERLAAGKTAEGLRRG